MTDARTREPQLLMRVVESDYQRSLYFGENMLTVYAELINVQSSTLAISIMANTSTGECDRFIFTALSIWALCERSTKDASSLEAAINRSLAFARKQASYFHGKLPIYADSTTQNISRTLAQAYRTNKNIFTENPQIQKIARLITRLMTNQSHTAGVVHAIHLLCNKVGLNFVQEYLLFKILSKATHSLDREVQHVSMA
jgi:hypothetical protein